MDAGGSEECKSAGCKNRAKVRGLCISHGGGTKCSVADCTTMSASRGLCWVHGGGKRAARVPLTNDCSMLAQTDAHCAVAGEPAQNGTRGNKLDSRLHCAADVALLAAVVLPPGQSVQGGLGAAGVPPMP